MSRRKRKDSNGYVTVREFYEGLDGIRRTMYAGFAALAVAIASPKAGGPTASEAVATLFSWV